MAQPDGARTKRIPTLSWDSVVESPSAAVASPEPVVDPAPDALVRFEPLQLDPPAEPASSALPIAPPIPTAPAFDDALTPDEPTVVRTTPPTVIVPALGDVTSGPESVAPAAPPAPPAPAAPAPAAPPAPDAAPVPSSPAPPIAAPASGSATDALPEIREATPVVEQGGPLLPSIPAPAPAPATTPSAFEFDPGAVAPGPSMQPRGRKKRGGLKLFATLIMLGAVVAAGFVFGQTYLAPSDWNDTTAPYADAVESARGVAFAEPLAIVAEPTAEFVGRSQTQLAPISPEESAQWRALGLASGSVDDATLAGQLAGWQNALYSTTDGQVYHDLGVAGPELDAELTQAMAAASLDQEFGWSTEQERRGLDAEATTSAEVLRQVRSVQQSTEFSAPVPPASSGAVAALPTVVGYRLLAPQVFVEFDASIEPAERTNPLDGLGAGGPGILGSEIPVLATGPTMFDGDTMITSPGTKDRSFWYLVFAGYLDSRTARSASEAIVESSLTGAMRGPTECAYATFSGGDIEQTNTLRSALTAWTAAAPPEVASSFLALPDGTLQLASCDPGAGFANGVRPDVASELISWRIAELATMEAVRVGGGGAAEFADAWTFVESSPVALDLMTLPPTTTPSEMATAAKEAVNALFTPAG